ncbi:hypothetical protein [Shewanella sp. SM78]|uniref:phosphorylase family protein n=1 Tax=Shewanella sp. SM78 TaxID=2912810 RepID=UPI0021D7F084|nr:hypothetical protein [Shewanella sp. SM78]MCU8024175.1 hypothetical protein [Shewanella sp. SM78]
MKKVKLLIVEDKYENILKLGALVKSSVIDAQSVQVVTDAQRQILNAEVDVLLTDIQIPDSLGDDINLQGGIDLIEWISLIPSYQRPKKIIAVTSQQATYDKWKDHLFNMGVIFVRTMAGNSSLATIVENSCNYLQSESVSDICSNGFPKFDIAILTALRHNELQAVLDLPIDWNEKVFPNDPSIYHTAMIETKFGQKSLICTHLPRMGMSAASCLATKVTLQFQPDYLLMTGIAAGVEGKCKIGDILIADTCWDWGTGKLTEEDNISVFKCEPHQEVINAQLKSRLQSVVSSQAYVDEISRLWRGAKPNFQLTSHLGPIVSGAVVLEDEDTISNILSQHRKVIGIEMEAYGVMSAVSSSSSNGPKVLIIKSVCDFANTDKNDDWQEYASFTSANYAYQLIYNNLEL